MSTFDIYVRFPLQLGAEPLWGDSADRLRSLEGPVGPFEGAQTTQLRIIKAMPSDSVFVKTADGEDEPVEALVESATQAFFDFDGSLELTFGRSPTAAKWHGGHVKTKSDVPGSMKDVDIGPASPRVGEPDLGGND